MLKRKVNTKLLVDGGDPLETVQTKNLLGFVDGQTTNPTLISKNPEITRLIVSGHRFTMEEEMEEYKRIVQAISPLVGDAGVSIEVFADSDTTAEQMLAQGREMNTWIPNGRIKYPTTHEGLRAAQISVYEGIRINMTLCFSQEQAAAVYAATRGAQHPVYISPFLGRLDDQGYDGMDLIRNMKKMFAEGDGHVHVLAASIRNLNHLLGAFHSGAELATAPAKVWQEWAAASFPLPENDFVYKNLDKTGKRLRAIPFKSLELNQSWELFDIQHDLTTKGIQQFVSDYKNTIRESA